MNYVQHLVSHRVELFIEALGKTNPHLADYLTRAYDEFSTHTKLTEYVPQVKKQCTYVFQKGNKIGQKCQTMVVNGMLCSKHKKGVIQPKTNLDLAIDELNDDFDMLESENSGEEDGEELGEYEPSECSTEFSDNDELEGDDYSAESAI